MYDLIRRRTAVVGFVVRKLPRQVGSFKVEFPAFLSASTAKILSGHQLLETFAGKHRSIDWACSGWWCFPTPGGI